MDLIHTVIELEVALDKGLFTQSWSDATTMMSPEEYKAAQKETVRQFLASGAKFMLVDSKKFLFTINPELQDWTFKEVIVPLYNGGLEKIAYLMTEDFFANMAIEQTLSFQPYAQLNRRYFRDEETALAWLLD